MEIHTEHDHNEYTILCVRDPSQMFIPLWVTSTLHLSPLPLTAPRQHWLFCFTVCCYSYRYISMKSLLHQNPINPTQKGPDRCCIMEYSRLSDGTYNNL